MNHTQRAVVDFHKMAEKRFAEVDENEEERIVNSAVPETPNTRHSFG